MENTPSTDVESTNDQFLKTAKELAVEHKTDEILFIIGVNETQGGGPIIQVEIISIHDKIAVAERQQVVSLWNEKILIFTLAINPNDIQEVLHAEITGYDTKTESFIRTLPDGTKHNNLGKLPAIQSSTAPLFDTIEKLKSHLFNPR